MGPLPRGNVPGSWKMCGFSQGRDGLRMAYPLGCGETLSYFSCVFDEILMGDTVGFYIQQHRMHRSATLWNTMGTLTGYIAAAMIFM